MSIKDLLIEQTFKDIKFDNRRLSRNKELIDKINEITSFLSSNSTLAQRAWHVYNDLFDYPKCQGGNYRYSFISFDHGYRNSCHLKRGQCQHCLDAFNKKRKETCLERYGTDSFSKTSLFREKSVETCQNRYGADNFFQTTKFQDKRKETCLERYGVEHPMRSNIVKDKWKQTCLTLHGELPSFSKKARESAKQTCLERYGVINISQKHLTDILPFIQDQNWWNSFKSIYEIMNELKHRMAISNIYLYINRFRHDLIGTGFLISSPHQKIIDLLDEYKIEHEVNTRKVIPPKELDIFIPSKNLAIEVNGIYWHSELNGKDKSYHLSKTEECEKQGVQLLQFWDTEIEDRWDIVASMILNRLNCSSFKIGARQCRVVQVNKSCEKEFLDKNHLQGYTPSTVCLGLEYQNELVSLMSFGNPRFNKKINWELLRFCNKLNTQVIGGASRLFFRRPNGSIVSYADRRYSVGKLYENLNLRKTKVSNPSYWYTNGCQLLQNRMKYQKHKLPRLLETFDPSLTEWENMQLNGYDRVWDCRNYGVQFEFLKS
jgi:very-short-patch-repair endonuclease